jgi:hypothetical protein
MCNLERWDDSYNLRSPMQAGLARPLIPKATASADFLTYTNMTYLLRTFLNITDSEFVGNGTLLLDIATSYCTLLFDGAIKHVQILMLDNIEMMSPWSVYFIISTGSV